ncbi:hypothetical protein [Streptomyces sp. enrichment culture]|uniref:hypothetical protein n=1 Tax=Streptomyces sp. enrichment culture TaxID=1795815 RepID=UPI003F562440
MRNGDLDLGSEKSREAEKVLSDLAANTDAAATAAREQGRSWEYVSGIYDRGRESFVQAAQAMGLTKQQAEALAQSYLQIPDKKSTTLEMRTEDAITGLDSVIAAIKRTPDAKSVTVKALTADAISLLEALGFTVKQLPDGRFQVIADTATAGSRLRAIQGEGPHRRRHRSAAPGRTDGIKRNQDHHPVGDRPGHRAGERDPGCDRQGAVEAGHDHRRVPHPRYRGHRGPQQRQAERLRRRRHRPRGRRPFRPRLRPTA